MYEKAEQGKIQKEPKLPEKAISGGASRFTWLLFIVYLAILLWIILFKFQFSLAGLERIQNINLIPFHESLIVNGRLDLDEIIMNAVIFIPFGIYISTLRPDWPLWKKTMSFAGASLLLEVLQFVLAAGRSDITDLITNSLGGLSGGLIYYFASKICVSRAQTAKLVNLVACIGTICIIGFLILLLCINS